MSSHALAKPSKQYLTVPSACEDQANELLERRFEGIAVAPGLVIGPAIIHWEEKEDIPYRSLIPEKLIPQEIARFESALVATRAELLEIQQKIASAIGAEDASIFDAHLLVVEDQTLIDEVLKSVETYCHNVEYAFYSVAEKYCRSLSAIDDPYLRERAIDIEDVVKRVLRHLLGKNTSGIHQQDQPHIIIAHNLKPSDTALLDRSLVLGFATETGSKTSHTTIMARSLNIPAIVGLHDICSHVAHGDLLLLDGYHGVLIVHPSSETCEHYTRLASERDQILGTLDSLRNTISATQDGRHIILSANIELPKEMEDVSDVGAEGVGLYRTEFLFLNRKFPPSENEQYENYALIAERSYPYSVIIRTLDIGGDKNIAGMDLPHEENPFLGCRAIRFCLKRLDIFKPQLRAILRASHKGSIKMLFPMISSLGELHQVQEVLKTCQAELRSEGLPFNEKMEVGMMIEVPSAAITADLLAEEVDFFSIGTNDLIQYTLAVDRINDRITHLYKPTHPAIIRLIQMVVQAAHQKGIWVGLCGEMAGDIQLIPLLIGLDIDELSTAPIHVPRIKKAIQSLDVSSCHALLNQALKAKTSVDILKICLQMARERYGELLT